MLRWAWIAPSKAPQFNSGCRKLAMAAYPPETGLGDMPPVEKEMTTLTSLGPTRVMTDPHCPNKECDKSDRLACRTFNAAARAARSGNALAVLLAAIRKITSAGDQDTRDLVDVALSAHAQLTRDVGAAMSAILTRRQIWLAQTTLPDGIKRELINMPVESGNVFHADSIHFLERAEHSLCTESVQRTFRHPILNTRGRPHPYPTVSGPPEPWRGNTCGKVNVQAIDPAARRAWRSQPRSSTRRAGQARPPPRVQGPKGVLHRICGAAAEVHSQLRLDSLERETLGAGNNCQGIQDQVSAAASTLRRTTVKDPVQADCLEEITTLMEPLPR